MTKTVTLLPSGALVFVGAKWVTLGTSAKQRVVLDASAREVHTFTRHFSAKRVQRLSLLEYN